MLLAGGNLWLTKTAPQPSKNFLQRVASKAVEKADKTGKIKKIVNKERRHVESWRTKRKESYRTKQQQQEQLLINLRKEF